MFGFLNIDKPSGITSHKVISVLRKITGIKQIGHAGTLDPLASGVLPVAIGKASKLIDYLNEDKCYEAGMYLGQISDTFDTDGTVSSTGFRKIELEEIKKILPAFQGELKQIPPVYSAVHYNGKRLYELARSGNIPSDIPSRNIIVYRNEILNFDYEKQILKLCISCSKGTYIRSLINDLGQTLGCGCVMFELRRTKSSGMDINSSVKISDSLNLEDIKENLINPINIVELPHYEVSEKEYEILVNGNKFKNKSGLKDYILLIKSNRVLGLAFADSENIQPKKVLM